MLPNNAGSTISAFSTPALKGDTEPAQANGVSCLLAAKVRRRARQKASLPVRSMLMDCARGEASQKPFRQRHLFPERWLNLPAVRHLIPSGNRRLLQQQVVGPARVETSSKPLVVSHAYPDKKNTIRLSFAGFNHFSVPLPVPLAAMLT